VARQVNSSPTELSHYENFRAIRLKVKQSCSTAWTVKKMAELAHLSPNRFAVLYRKLFRVSPIDDLINTRIDKAKQLLLYRRHTVSEISAACGFSRLNYFSRLFKEKTGVSPAKYIGDEENSD